jgi:hypothetical protein
MKKLMVVLLFSTPVFASDIRFPYQRRWNMEQYLTYFLTQIPRAQMQNIDAEHIRLRGRLVLDFSKLPADLGQSVHAELSKALAGQRKISGAYLDSEYVQIEVPSEEIEQASPVQLGSLEPHQFQMTDYSGPPQEAAKYEQPPEWCRTHLEIER